MSHSEQQIHSEQNIENLNEHIQGMEMQAEKSEFSQDFQSDEEVMPEVQVENEGKKQIQTIPKVTNPISAYSVFMKQWRQSHKGQKASMSAIGQIWKQLNKQEKEMYERKFREQKQKYEQYQTLMLSIDPNFGKNNKESSKNYFFPLHRVKAIMKLDNAFTATSENVSTMAKCAEYFGQYLLEEVKKLTESKKRVDMNDMFEAINNNQNNLWFLNCLIDEHNLQNSNPNRAGNLQNKRQKVGKMNEQKKQKKKQEKREEIGVRSQKSVKTKTKSKKDIPKGQLKLTDMF